MWVPGETTVLRDAVSSSRDLVDRALLEMKHACDA